MKHSSRRILVGPFVLGSAVLAACAPPAESSRSEEVEFTAGGQATLGAPGADPGVMYAGGRIHIYTTGGVVWHRMTDLNTPLDISTTLASPAEPTLAAPPSTLVGPVWAPTVRKIGDQYVMWYSGAVTSGDMCLWRATHGSPQPGFVNVSDTPICGPPDAHFTIAPDLEELPSGPVLYVKTLGKIMVHRLDATGTNLLAGDPWQTVIEPGDNAPWERLDESMMNLIEGPAMVKLEGGDPVKSRWYIFYSGSGWRTPDYGIGYGDCHDGDEPVYPCEKITRDGVGPWLHTGNAGGPHGPGAGSFFHTDGKTYLVAAGWKDRCDLAGDDCKEQGSCADPNHSCVWENDGARSSDGRDGRRLYLYHVWLGSDVTGDGIADPHFLPL